MEEAVTEWKGERQLLNTVQRREGWEGIYLAVDSLFSKVVYTFFCGTGRNNRAKFSISSQLQASG
jgi:hypothetical protein